VDTAIDLVEDPVGELHEIERFGDLHDIRQHCSERRQTHGPARKTLHSARQRSWYQIGLSRRSVIDGVMHGLHHGDLVTAEIRCDRGTGLRTLPTVPQDRRSWLPMRWGASISVNGTNPQAVLGHH
jgi:hypothetical protein